MPVKPRVVASIERVSTYLPLIGTAVLLLISTFAEGVLKSVPIAILLAIMATSFVLTAVHLESNLAGAKDELSQTRHDVQDLGQRIDRLESTQADYLRSAQPDLRVMELGDGFRVMSERNPRIGHLRIYAISSQQILSFLRFYPFHVEKCSVLLRGFPDDDAQHRDFASQIKLAVRDWRAMVPAGRIDDLSIRSYDFFPTEYECIFDGGSLLLGLYDSDPDDYSEVRVRGVTLIEASTPAGQQVVNQYIERFDNLFATCASAHGPDYYPAP
jgi:hypothetical protein